MLLSKLDRIFCSRVVGLRPRYFSTSGSESKIDHVPSLKDFLQQDGAGSSEIQTEEEIIGGSHMEELFK